MDSHPRSDIEELTIAQMAADMTEGRRTAADLVAAYLERIDAIDRGTIDLRSIIVINPDAAQLAEALDNERRQGRVRGPLHGVPILLKDNIDTDDAMATTAGSLALADSHPGSDATVAARLRAAGAVVLAKANLSEWANFRSAHGVSGWSAVGGGCRNPYVLDRTPAGSSSGSGAAVSANLAAAALGTETDGSIVAPASANGVVGIKPTVGLTSRAGVVPISYSQDTVGPLARTVADAAAVLSAIAGPDQRDPATAEAAEPGSTHPDYTRFLDPDGLTGARLGAVRQTFPNSPVATALFDRVVGRMREQGAEVVDPVELPSWDEVADRSVERGVLKREFKSGIAAYLATRDRGPRTLADLIRFNRDNPESELRWFGQEVFELAEATDGVDDAGYPEMMAVARRLSRQEGLDAALDGHRLDALVAPTMSPAWAVDMVNGDPSLGGSASYAAMAGYPLISMPMGMVDGLPVGLTLMGRRWSEPTLIRLASGFEARLGARQPPRFLSTVERG